MKEQLAIQIGSHEHPLHPWPSLLGAGEKHQPRLARQIVGAEKQAWLPAFQELFHLLNRVEKHAGNPRGQRRRNGLRRRRVRLKNKNIHIFFRLHGFAGWGCGPEASRNRLARIPAFSRDSRKKPAASMVSFEAIKIKWAPFAEKGRKVFAR